MILVLHNRYRTTGGEERAVELVELDVTRPGDVNRHRYRDEGAYQARSV